MSSTARGGQRSPADFYSTPFWPIHRLLERLPLPGGMWFETSAGDGSIIRAVNEVRSGITWAACELREECRPALTPLVSELHIGDFFGLQPGPFKEANHRPTVSLNNPPFSLAMEFIEHSLKFAPIVIHLLRLNFLGTAERNGFFKSNMPDVYVVPDRISFTADGRADSIEYAFFVFGYERGRRAGRIEVLDTTPVEVRRQRRAA